MRRSPVMIPAPAVSTPVSSVHAKPTTADPEDEEFDGASVPSGWGMIRADTGALLTPSVGVDCWTPNTAIANAPAWQVGYRRSCLTAQIAYRGGTTNPMTWLFRPLVTPITLSNPASNPPTTPFCFRTRLLGTLPLMQQVTQGGQGTVVFGLAKDNGGKPDIANWIGARVVVYPGNNAASIRLSSQWAGVNGGAVQDLQSQNLQQWGLGFQGLDHLMLAVTKYRYFFAGFGSENVHFPGGVSGINGQGYASPATFSHLFWTLSWDGPVSANQDPSGLYHVDYVRKSANLP